MTTKQRMHDLLHNLLEKSYALKRHPELQEEYLNYLIEKATKLLKEKQSK